MVSTPSSVAEVVMIVSYAPSAAAVTLAPVALPLASSDSSHSFPRTTFL